MKKVYYMVIPFEAEGYEEDMNKEEFDYYIKENRCPNFLLDEQCII